MEKLVYVLWKPADLSAVQFKDTILGPVAARMKALGVCRLSVNLADEDVAAAQRVRITRFDPPLAGTISFWLDNADDRGPYEAALAPVTARAAGYLVVESVPIVNTTQTAPLGARTPGINMVACIECPEGMRYADWIAHWRGPHKRVALETQCTFSYVRNVVVQALTDDAPPWAGIVEEGFPAAAVTDPMLWYCGNGSVDTMQRNMARMIESVQAFLDVSRVESHPMSAYRLTA